MPAPDRFAPNLTFPAYSYVPGLWPHPFSAAAGHRMNGRSHSPIDLDAPLADQIVFREALDLFNHGYYWEAHELWEELWHAAGRSGSMADFFKGLIQLAVAGVKIREGRLQGVTTHARRAAELFAGLMKGGQSVIWGAALADMIANAEKIAVDPPPTPEQPRQPVEIVFDWRLG